jgi:hypothetical protein
MLQAGPPSLHYYCAVVLHSCTVLPPVCHSSNHQYHCCQLTKQSSCVSYLFFFGACCKRGSHLYTTTAPSCCIPTSYCHLSATLQTISITVVNLQDNRAVFRICSSLVHVASGAAIFTLLLRRRVLFLHRTATCLPLFKPSVSLLSTCKTIERCFEFIS